MGVLKQVAALACATTLGVGIGCFGGNFVCEADAQCPDGQCEPEGWCSFPDEDCPSGHRFGGLAGDGLAGDCTSVGAESTGSTTTALPSTSTTSPTSDTLTGTDESTGPVDDCGNGVVDAGEDCDDGNESDSDGCNTDCVESGSLRWSLTHTGEAHLLERGNEVLVQDAGIVVVGREDVAADMRHMLLLEISFDGALRSVSVESSVDGGGGSIISGLLLPGDEFVVVGQATDAVGAVSGFIARYGADLERIWLKTSDSEEYAGLALDSDGLLVAAGYVSVGTDRFSTVQRWTLDGEPMEIDTEAIVSFSRHRDIVAVGDDVFAAGTHGNWPSCVMSGVVSTTTAPLVLLHEFPPASGGCSDAQAIAAHNGELIVAGFTTVRTTADRISVVTRLDSDFSVDWTDEYDQSSASEEFEDVAVAADGDIVVVGFASTDADLDSDFMVRRYSPEGTIRWTQIWDVGPDDVARGIGFTDEGNIIVTGELEVPGEGEDAYVACLAP